MIGDCLVEGFVEALSSGKEGIDGFNIQKGSKALANFLVFIIYVIIILAFGKFLWNEVATKLISVLKPADSIWQVLGLAILLRFITLK